MSKEKNPNPPATTTKKHKSWVRWIWLALIIGLAAIALFMFILSKQDLPSFKDLENPDIKSASTLYADGGEVLRRFYVENRVPIPYQELNPHIINCLVATEDKRYHNHAGIDFKALFRVGIKTVVLRQRSSGGGSTITQQLAKQLYTGKRSKSKKEVVIQKLKEWITSVKLEKSYTKEEIMAMYLNNFDYIYNSHGIQAASETYFGKNQEDLNLEEAAVLVGMLKNPSLYNPKKFPENARGRRNVVLQLTEQAGHINKETRDSLQSQPIDISGFKRSSHDQGSATYFAVEVAKDIKKILAQDRYKKSDGTHYDLYRDGLKIYTTIDAKMQELAEEVMVKHMKKVQKTFFKEWGKKDPWTYDDEKIDVSLKKRMLKKQMMETERYQQMLQTRFGKDLEQINTDADYNLRPVDITRLLDSEKSSANLTKLISSKIISKKLADKYKKILKLKSWKNISSSWKDFEKYVDTVFDTKRKMAVFTYNANFEKDTVMTPMDSLKYHRMHLQTGIVAMEPETGHIKVWVGGINNKYFKYDHVRTDRQVGSTFKPFIYSSAIFFKGISPCFQVEDIPYTIEPNEGNFSLAKPWTPKNATGKYTREWVSLYTGLRKSMNTVSVYLMKEIGDTELVRNLVDNMGISATKKRSNGTYRLPKQPSLALGAVDLTVKEMTGAYTTFANNGVYNEPAVILRIEDKNGKLIYSATPKTRVVLDPKKNYVMVNMLTKATEGVPGFSGVKTQFGGKTGTTNDHTDGWFMGITPNLVVGTWVGGSDKWIRFRNFGNGQGSRMARPFFSSFLQALEKDKDIDFKVGTQFKRPAEDLGIEIDCEKYHEIHKPKSDTVKVDDVFGEGFDDF